MCDIPSGNMATRPFCLSLAEMALNALLFEDVRGAPSALAAGASCALWMGIAPDQRSNVPMIGRLKRVALATNEIGTSATAM